MIPNSRNDKLILFRVFVENFPSVLTLFLYETLEQNNIILDLL